MSANKLVYNRITEDESKLIFDIVLYDIKTKSTELVARGQDYINNYLYNVAIDDNIVAYTCYHDVNNDTTIPERDTTYKYCDVYIYDINTKKTNPISFNDFIVGLDVFGNHLAGIRYAPITECKDYLNSAELVIYNIHENEWKSFIYGESNLSAPTFCREYLVFRNFASDTNNQVYDYMNNKFVNLSKEKELVNCEIVGATKENILITETSESNGLYMLTLK